MAGGDRGLQRVRAVLAAELFRARQRGQAPADQQLVPPRAVLIQQQHRLAGRPGTGRDPGGLDFHQGHQPVHLGLGRGELSQQAAQPQCFGAEVRPHPVIAGGGRVALVEDEVHDLQHGCQPGGPLLAVRRLERHAGLAEGPLGPDDALRDRRLRDQVGAGDLGRTQPAEQAERERHPGRDGQHGVARGEDQPQHVVVDVTNRVAVLVAAGAEPGPVQGPADLVVLALQVAVAAEQVDGAPLGHGRQPAAGAVRDAARRPLLQRRDHGVLGQLLGQADVAGVVSQRGDQAGPLQPDHRVDRCVRLRTCHATMTPPAPRPGQDAPAGAAGAQDM